MAGAVTSQGGHQLDLYSETGTGRAVRNKEL